MPRSQQLHAIGPLPPLATMLLGTILWGSAPESLELVSGDDFESPTEERIFEAVRSLVAANRAVSPQLVRDELIRLHGRYEPFAAVLRNAVTCGASPEAARQYASAVVAESLRRRVFHAGHSLLTASDDMAEEELAEFVARVARGIADCAGRLARLRERC